jgi:THO complex subunit 5
MEGSNRFHLGMTLTVWIHELCIHITMVVPLHIGEPSPLDPSLVLPLPSKLPSDPTQALEQLSAAIEAQLDPSIPSSSKLPMQVITAQIRSIHRKAQISVNAARSGTAEERARLDAVDVDLRTIEYERDRVRDEINRCAEYAYVGLLIPGYVKLIF